MAETTKFGGPEHNIPMDGALATGTILVARYRITGVLGGGGQGAVYQARDLNFPDVKRFVAIKEMRVSDPDEKSRQSALRNFTREANILAELRHPAIPQIYDSFSQNDRAYLIMEYINGSDLEALLVKTKKLPVEKVLDWAIELCDVLHYLHSYQPEPIIFRDMKPANIMIDSLGKVRLIDFGIAKTFTSGIKHTQIGTEGYSAPEQYKGNVTPLSDIYSLGATLHHVLTREDPRLQTPFSFAERPIRQYNSDVSPQFASIVEKCLAFESENRWQSCAEIKQALESLRYRPVQAASAAPVKQAAASSAPSGTGFFDDIGETIDGGIKPKWTFKTEDEIRCTPASFGNLALVGSYDTNLWAIKLDTGEFAWKKATEGGIVSSPTVETGLRQVFFGSEDGNYYAVDARDGRISWSYTTGDKIRGGGRLGHGHVFFGSDDGNLYAILANNGRLMWQYDAASPIRTTPFVTNDRVIFGTEGGEVLALELNGARKWAFRSKKPFHSSPYVDMEGVCYIGGFDGFLYAIDANSGYSHWRYRTNGAIISSPTVEGNNVIFGSTDGKLYCVNTQTSKEKWVFDTSKPIVSSPVVHDGNVYFGGTNGCLYCVDLKTGKETWHYQTEGAITSTAHIAEGIILIGSIDKTLYAFPLVQK